MIVDLAIARWNIKIEFLPRVQNQPTEQKRKNLKDRAEISKVAHRKRALDDVFSEREKAMVDYVYTNIRWPLT
jgi:hypothetical protein